MKKRALSLYAPISYHQATCKEKERVCNGCGAKGGIPVPDTIWGLDISPACNVHDWMFEEGMTHADFLFANGMFQVNMTRIIVNESANKFMVMLRLRRASKYFDAVATLGEDIYWKNKRRNNGMYITYKGEFR